MILNLTGKSYQFSIGGLFSSCQKGVIQCISLSSILTLLFMQEMCASQQQGCYWIKVNIWHVWNYVLISSYVYATSLECLNPEVSLWFTLTSARGHRVIPMTDLLPYQPIQNKLHYNIICTA